jgi:hypothetical protein
LCFGLFQQQLPNLLSIGFALQERKNPQHVSPDAIAAMKQFSEALLCSTCAPDGDVKVKGFVQ